MAEIIVCTFALYFLVGVFITCYWAVNSKEFKDSIYLYPSALLFSIFAWPLGVIRIFFNLVSAYKFKNKFQVNDPSIYKSFLARKIQNDHNVSDSGKLFYAALYFLCSFDVRKSFSHSPKSKINNEDLVYFELGCYLFSSLNVWVAHHMPKRKELSRYFTEEFTLLTSLALGLREIEASKIINERYEVYKQNDPRQNLEWLTDFILFAHENGASCKDRIAPLSLNLSRFTVFVSCQAWIISHIKGLFDIMKSTYPTS